jgi:ribonuclease J
MMLNLVRPKYFIPVHGEYRMLRRHAELAEATGVEPKNILIGDNGNIFEFTPTSGAITGRVQAGRVFVDGLGVGDVGSVVLRDRKQLSQDGIIIAILAVSRKTGHVVSGPELVSRGFVYVRDSDAMMTEARKRIETALESCIPQTSQDWGVIKTKVRDVMGKFLYEKTKRRPMILPIVLEVD